MSQLTVVNFGHLLTESQIAAMQEHLNQPIGRIIDCPTNFDDAQPFEPQVRALIDGIEIDWQQTPIIVNPPTLSVIATGVLAQLHGLLGHFPAIIRLRRVPNAIPTAYEFAEMLDLNQLRDRSLRFGDGERSHGND